MQFMCVVLNATNALSKSSVTCFTGIGSFLLDCQIKVERHTLGHFFISYPHVTALNVQLSKMLGQIKNLRNV